MNMIGTHFTCVKNMPILEIKNEITLRFTYECNWNCPYCAIRNSREINKSVSHENVLECIKKIPENSKVTISGGEPGLVSKDKIDLYLNLLILKNCELYLETNGTFIKQYPEYLKHFKEILFHCSVNLEKISIIIINIINNIINIYNINIKYLLIIHDKNIFELENFINFYPEIKFDIIEATYPFEITGPTLSKKNKNYLITHFSKHMTHDSLKRLISGKNFESIKYLN